MTLNKFKQIIWDFDGVIIDSDPIRELGFVSTLKSYPKDKVDLLIEYHRKNGGLSRYNKFTYFFKNIMGDKNIDKARINDLAESFSLIMKKKLIDKNLLIDDSIRFILKNYKNFVMHIASGSDHNELNYLCVKLGIDHYFNSINGSPMPKNKIVENIILRNSICLKSEFVLIGDSINDLEAANFNNINFIGYNNNKLCKKNEYINSFSNYII